MTDPRTTAACHEAGHATIAWSLSKGPEWVELAHSTAHGWLGGTQPLPLPDHMRHPLGINEAMAKISMGIAGVLAQARAQYEVPLDAIEEAEIGPFLERLRACRMGVPLNNFELSLDGQPRAISPDWFSPPDARGLHRGMNDCSPVMHRTAVIRTIETLNDGEAWERVRSVGKALLESPTPIASMGPGIQALDDVTESYRLSENQLAALLPPI